MILRILPLGLAASLLACGTPRALPARPSPDPARIDAPAAPWSSSWLTATAAAPAQAPAKAAAQASRYACPMHPEVTATAPGECPRCGMDLEAQEEAR